MLHDRGSIIPLAKKEPAPDGRALQRQKSEMTSTTTTAKPTTQTQKPKTQPTLVPIQHHQQQTSADEAKIALLEQKIEVVQTQQMDLLAYISDVKQNQHTNQSKLTSMNNKIELIDHKNQIALREI
jgi:hypothetical protein